MGITVGEGAAWHTTRARTDKTARVKQEAFIVFLKEIIMNGEGGDPNYAMIGTNDVLMDPIPYNFSFSVGICNY